MLSSRHQQYLHELPHDWEQVPLQELGTICTGGTPSRAVPYYWNGSIAWVTPGELTTLGGKWLTKTREYITEAGLASSAAKLMPKGTLLVTSRASIGAIAVAALSVCTNQGFKSIIPNQLTCSDFYYHLLQLISPEMVRLASGTTFLEISRKDFSAILLPRPPLPEQRRIADILDTVDAAIQQTEALIAKLKLMKAGLLHDLLTRGLDEQGNLRDPIAHPEQFKDSPLGRIPRGWEVSTLAKLILGKISNGFFKKPELVGSGYPLVNVLDLYQDFGIDLNSVERVRASKQEQHRYAIRPGDCFFTRSSLNLSGIAHCNVIRDVPEPALYECHLMRIRPDQEQIIPEFFAHWCRSPWARKFFIQRAKQVTMTTISQPDIAPLPVPLPSKTEQKTIVEMLDAHDARIRTEEAYCDKLKQLKQGLMRDLLTGRVRVRAEKEVR